MSDDGVTEAFFACDGATFPRDIDTHGEPLSRISTYGDTSERSVRITQVSTRVIDHLPPRAQDLLALATYASAIDQRIDRGTTAIDVHRQRWRRRLHVAMPVRDLEFWSQPEIVPLVQQALHVASEDTWRLSFTQASFDFIQPSLFPPGMPRMYEEADTVVLFSGGMDSLCATVSAMAEDGRRPLVVSRGSSNHVDKWQTDLLARLRTSFPAWELPHIVFTMNQRNLPKPESSQRTRAFLYVALGAAIAASDGIDRIVLADNGYVSLNPQISGAITGALASRGTHPMFLRVMNQLLRYVFTDRRMTLENPLRYATRAEALSMLTNHGQGALIADTRSCGKHRGPERTRHVPHCGGCSQCVDRRTAVIRTVLEDVDPRSRYGIDIFTDTLPDGEIRDFVVSYFRFAQDLHERDADTVLDLVSLDTCLDPDSPDVTTDAIQLADVLVRHSQEAVTVLSDMYRRHAADLGANRLSEGSLLRILPTRPALSDPLLCPGTSQPSSLIDRQMEPPTLVRSGAFWEVVYDGEKAVFRDSKGMHYLAHLLNAPGTEMHVHTLMSGARPGGVGSLSREDELHISNDRYPVLDIAARRAYEDRARAIQNELQQDPATARREELLGELDVIATEMSKATAKGGTSRAFATDDEKARSAVSKAIYRALRHIEDELPSLGAHLKAELSVGVSCIYHPRPLMRWQVAA
jgi:7-cyano-7-deazaguanine synthase in queuosine biosynthesis